MPPSLYRPLILLEKSNSQVHFVLNITPWHPAFFLSRAFSFANHSNCFHLYTLGTLHLRISINHVILIMSLFLSSNNLNFLPQKLVLKNLQCYEPLGNFLTRFIKLWGIYFLQLGILTAPIPTVGNIDLYVRKLQNREQYYN